MQKKLGCISIILLISLASYSQIPFLRSHPLFSGKEEYNVQTIYQDISGMIWFGSDKGLFRFDGITLEAFTVSDGIAEDRISAIGCVQDGTIWIGHTGGDITIYDGREFNVFKPEEGLGKVEITDISVDQEGSIWYSTLGEGIFKYNGRHMSNLSIEDGLSDNYVYDIDID
jgi:ligand-binding sensor domain-containing protein